jgi:hypothetical protein
MFLYFLPVFHVILGVFQPPYPSFKEEFLSFFERFVFSCNLSTFDN